MMTIQSIKAGDTAALAKYFDALAGVEDYYGDEQELEGYWSGSASESFGLVGAVQEGQLIKALQGFDPIHGKSIADNSGNGHKPGWDCTFSAPKTVSAVWAVSDEATRNSIEEVHRKAVEGATKFLEAEAIVCRYGKAGSIKIPVADAKGAVFAVFQHSTSREQDPQLHSHCVLMNFSGDGRGLDVDTHWQTAGGAYYRAELAKGMLALGFSVERDDIPGREDRPRFFKVSGLSDGLIDVWSKRRAQVQEAKAEWLTDGATAARFSRKNKGEISREALFREWGMQALAHGIDRDGVEQLRLEVRSGMEASSVPVLLDRLTFNDSTFRRSDLVTILLEDAQGVTGGAQAIERAGALLTHEDVIQLSDRLFTTRQMLQLEAAMVNRAVQLVGQAHEAAHGVDSAQFTHQVELIGLDKKLSEQQMQALRHVTANSQFAVIQGHAGAGKSYLMGAAREAWQASRLDVLGVALSNAAAKNLNQEAGIHSTSVHAFLAGLEAGRVRLSPDTVLVVDEAGMVGTRQMGRLLEAVNTAGAKMVLVGDSQQLQPVEAGGAMAGIMHQTGFLELTEVRRQSAEVDRRIASDLRRGRTGPALETLRKLNRLHLASDSKAVRREAVAAYLRDREAGYSVLLLAAKNAEVSSLNVGVHLSLQQSGEVAAEGVIVKVRQGYREFATGGRVMFKEACNLPCLGPEGGAFRVINGSFGLVVQAVAAGDDAAVLAIKLDSGEVVRVDTTRYNQLEHGYASTVNKAQGSTVDRVHVVVGTEAIQGKEWSYVAGSRHRNELHIYTTATAALTKNEKSVELAHSALAQTMSKSRQKDLATDHLVRERSQAPCEIGRVQSLGKTESGRGLSF